MNYRALSILIITYNRADDTLLLLRNLLQLKGFGQVVEEILLLNNNSEEDYSAIENFIETTPDSKIKYFKHSENLGVARGRNFLIPKAQGQYLLVIDDDMEFDQKDALLRLAGLFSKPFHQQRNTAVITFGVRYFENQKRQLSAFPHKNYQDFLSKEYFPTYYFAGGAHVVRRDIFEQVGLYTEDFFYGMEEYDLSYRIIEAGYALAYDDEVYVLHKESPAGRVPNKNKLAMLWLNKSKVAIRYLPKKYFYTTALMWSLQYLKLGGWDIKGWLRQWRMILSLPKKERRNPIGRKALAYLKEVEARLWY